MANWQLLIGANGTYTDYSQAAEFSSWRINASTRHRGSTCSGSLFIDSKALARPKGFQEVQLKDTQQGTTLFGGVILTSEQIGVTPTTYEYRVQCIDYTRWLDHVPAAPAGAHFPYGGRVHQVVIDLVTDWALASGDPVSSAFGGLVGPAAPLLVGTPDQMVGGLPGRVYPTQASIVSYSPNYIVLSQALDQLAKLVEATWYIDAYKRLVFCDPDAAQIYGVLQAPLPTGPITYFDQSLLGNFSRGLASQVLPYLDADNPVFRTGYATPSGQSALTAYRDLKLKEDVSATISAVTLRDYLELNSTALTESPDGATATIPNKKLVGDGTTRFFPLSFQPADPAHTTVNLRLAGHGAIQTTYSVANSNMKTEYIDGQPSDVSPPNVAYVCTTNFGIRFGTAPPNTYEIEVIYNNYQPGWDQIPNFDVAAEIARREGYGGGWYYQAMSDSSQTAPVTTTDGTPPFRIAEQVTMQRYGRFKYFASFASLLRGWLPGQQFGILSPNRGDVAGVTAGDSPYAVWGQTFSQRFFVTQIEIRLVGADGTPETQIDACSDIWGQ